jgi:hypothetical protein
VEKVDKDNMRAYRGCDLSGMGLKYIGQFECDNGFMLDRFRDIENKRIFIRLPSETVMEAISRVRSGDR